MKCDYTKYQKTMHLPWSPGLQNDDRLIQDMSVLESSLDIVITEKMDGENCLSQDVILITEDGETTIKEICETKYEGKVLCLDHESNSEIFSNILNHSILSNNNDWYEIELENGQTIHLTGNHRVWLPELMCYRQVRDLNGDEEFLLKK